MEKNKINDSDYVYILKAIAIFSVICAHVANVNSQERIIQIMSSILENIGSLGVGVFYFFAGYFFNTEKNFLDFFRVKVKKILIPWIFTGTIIYLYVNFRKGNIDIKEWIYWIIGYKTYLYFLTNLIFFYILYFVLKPKKKLIIVTIFLGVVSLNLNIFNFINNITPYLNPFNFITYFSVGKLVSIDENLKKLKEFSYKYKYISLFIFIIILFISQLLDIKVGYFSKVTLLFQVLSLVMFMGFGQSSYFNKAYIVDLGKKSFTIYLIHMPFAGIITYIFNKYIFLKYLILLRPFIVLYLTYKFINLLIDLTKISKFGIKINNLIGISEKVKQRS